MGLAIAVSLLLIGFQEPEPRDRFARAVDRHFDRYDPQKRSEVTESLHSLWKTLPEAGELRERGLMRIIRTIEGASSRFPVDPDRPDLKIPDRFHVRAYEIAVRQVRVFMANAVAFQGRTPETRAAIAGQINAVFDDALVAFLAKAADDEIQEKIRRQVESVRKDVHLKALDDPFGGYLKPLDAAALKDLGAKIARAADPLPVLYETGRAYDPARFATYDEDNALLEEVKAWRAEEKKKTEKPKERER